MAESATRIFLRARSLSHEARSAQLEQACGSDAGLRREVESLLEHDRAAAPWMSDSDPRRLLSELAAATLDDSDPAAGLPKRLGKYPIHGLIGRGGMGVVYRSEQENPRRPVALKILRSELADPASLRRFQQEVEILGRLSHPGIAQIYEAGTFDTELGRLPYLAMELVEGAPLLEHAHELSLPEKLERIVAIAEAIHHAHSKGVVHRDLKPSNLLVEEGGAIKVLDFGAARIGGEGTTLTTSGQMIGTVPYMSPEQLGGSSEVDARSDVYSLGVCLYQLLVGRLPIDIGERSLSEALRLLREREPTRLGVLDPTLAGDLETIVHHALAKERERRYASAAHLAEDLRRFLRHEPIQARPTSHLYVLAKLVRRQRSLAVAGVLVLAALLVAWLSTRAHRVESERVELLTTVQRLRELREGAIGLWPHVPHRRSALQTWLARSEALAAELPAWERRLRDARAGAESPEGLTWSFEDEAEQRFHDELSTLVTDLARFADPDPSLGLLADVRARGRQVEGLVGPSLGAHRDDWERCFAALDANPRYAGVALDIQPGLVPLREDPYSGLWEFWHEASGAAPRIEAASGRWRIEAETGLVLVLLPGGTFRMGAQNRDAEQPNWSFDLRADEMLVHEVRLAPFFLSKYELTQAQWERLLGERPSAWPPASDPLAGVHPVEGVPWEQCASLPGAIVLPSEAQWEYAARAGTDTTWFGGNDFDALGRYANIKDQSYRRTVTEDDVFTAWDDGHANHAPVGSFEPNAFGLHDILGNVWEWCRDTYGPYELPTDDWNAARVVLDPGVDHRVFRGGCYDSNITWSNSSARNHRPPSYRRASIGLRPVMMVRPL